MTENDIVIGQRYYARTSNKDAYVTIVRVIGKTTQEINQGKQRKSLPAWLAYDIDRERPVRICTIRKFLSKADD